MDAQSVARATRRFGNGTPAVLFLLAIATTPVSASQSFQASEAASTQRTLAQTELSEGEWATLKGAYEAARHKVFTVDGSLESINPGQDWTTRYDACGALTRPSDGAWTWGLSLQSWGYSGAQTEVAQPRSVTADENTVTFDWDPKLSEWWINDSRGLEHGFSVHSRPCTDDGTTSQTLDFELVVQGSLHPLVDTDRRGARFADESGVTAMTYSGLVAFDADGCLLPAWLESRSNDDGHRLLIRVRDTGARYPLTIDPLSQGSYLKASNPESGDAFGSTVSISGNTAVIGAPNEASNATGVNGDQTNNDVMGAGCAYVFVRSGTTWSQEAYLKPSNTDDSDAFGFSVSIAGDTIVIGAPGEGSDATGVNGDDTSNMLHGSGAAYVFTRTGTTWSQQAYLKAAAVDFNDAFGRSVSVDGDRVVVGMHGEASNATGVDGDATDNSAGLAGAAYVFARSGSSWAQEAYLKASNAEGRDSFGWSVAISADTVVVGATLEGSNARGVNGDQTNNSFDTEGAAYVFFHDGTAWAQQAYLKATIAAPGNGFFGGAVAVAGDTVVVGASAESDGTIDCGSAYVYGRTGMTWAAEAQLKASNPGDDDYFGESVSVSSRTIAVGSLQESSNATGIDGDQSNDLRFASGACYVFTKVGPRWLQQAYVKASNPGAGDRFGNSVCLSGNALLVGSPGEGSNAPGVNGDQSNNSAGASGAAYTFDLITPGTIGTNFCRPFALNSSMTHATITATGSDVASDNNLTLTVSGLPTAGTTALLLVSRAPTATLMNPGTGGVSSNGRLCIASGRMGRDRSNIYMGNAGTFSRSLNLTSIPFPQTPTVYTASVIAGETWFWQCWYRDGTGGQSNFSDAIGISFL